MRCSPRTTDLPRDAGLYFEPLPIPTPTGKCPHGAKRGISHSCGPQDPRERSARRMGEGTTRRADAARRSPQGGRPARAIALLPEPSADGLAEGVARGHRGGGLGAGEGLPRRPVALPGACRLLAVGNGDLRVLAEAAALRAP